MRGWIYMVYNDDVEDFYIGSSKNIINRKSHHKNKYNGWIDGKYKNFHPILYEYIKSNGGIDNWKFYILEENEFNNKKDLRIREQYYLNKVCPSLNQNNSYESKEERKERADNAAKEHYQKNKGDKVKCVCGIEIIERGMKKHLTSKKHLKYIANIVSE
jgi:hypothetical protein